MINSHGRSNNAFTLLELLVAISVLAILLIVLLSIVDGATRLWRVNENRVDGYREARAALNMIIADLNSIYAIQDKDFFKSTSGSDQLQFVSRIPNEYQDDREESEICEIGYELRYARTTPGGQETMNLYRSLVGSNRAFENLKGGKPFTGSGKTEELLARNIANFEVEAFTIDQVTGKLKEFNQAENPFPDLVEIRLTALNHETASKLKSRGDWANTTSPLYKQNAKRFNARIRIQSQPANSPLPTPSPTPVPVPDE